MTQALLLMDADDGVHRVLTTKVFVQQADVTAAADWELVACDQS